MVGRALRLTRRGRLLLTLTGATGLVVLVGLLAGAEDPVAPEDGAAGPVRPASDPPVDTAAPSPPASPTPTPSATPPGPIATVPPAPVPVPEDQVSASGAGLLVTAPGVGEPTVEKGRLVTYSVQVEDGLTVAGRPVDAAEVAEVVHVVLTDPRGWQAVDGVRFARVDSGPVDLTVVVASPDTTDRMCAPLRTGGWLSCTSGSTSVLNARRWFAGADSYGDDLVAYRQYLVSHEVGHVLGHQHVPCPGVGVPAPVMVQQTKSLDGCTANPWPAGA